MLLHRIKGTLVLNAIRALFNIVTSFLIAKYLGVDDFGRFSFLMATLVAFRSLVDMSSSNAFFTLISKYNRSKKYISIYYLWLLIQLLASSLIIYFLIPEDIFDSIWVGESRFLVIVAFCGIFSQFSVYHTSSQLGDAGRRNIKIAFLNVVLSAVYLALVIFLYYTHTISIEFIFYTIIFVWFVGSFVPLGMYDYCDKENLNFKEVLSEYMSYCLPLIPYAWIGLLYEFGERWMLQSWGGNVDQAHYSIAYKISFIPLFFTNSLLRIFWKETTEYFENENFKEMNVLFRNFCFYLVIISCFITFLVIPLSPSLLRNFVGEDYVNGSYTLNIMILATAFSCIHQVCSSVFYSTGQTKAYVCISLSTLTVGFIASYILLGPIDNKFCLSLGSLGLAYKFLGYQIISVLCFLYFLKYKFNYNSPIFFILINFSFFFLFSYLLNNLCGLFMLGDLTHIFLYILLYFLSVPILNNILNKFFQFNMFIQYKRLFDISFAYICFLK